MKLLCPAKINWTLQVLGRRTDGFHQLNSWFVGISLCDELVCQAGGSGLSISGNDELDSGEHNLVLQAERAWRAGGGQAPQLGWVLNKKIPVGSGLGGGSSDAAGALRLLEAAADRSLGAEACLKLAAELGSDVPFFLDGCGWQQRGGRGEQLLRSHDAPPRHLVVAFPGIEMSTSEVFSACGAAACEQEDFGEVDAAPPFQPGPNQLTAAAYQVDARLSDFGSQLSKHAAFQLSGSGGAHFATVEDVAHARLIVAALQDDGINAYPARTLQANEFQVEVPA